MAGWPRGEAAACKAVDTGSNPVPASHLRAEGPVGARVIHAHQHRVGDFAGTGRSAITPDVADDHRAVTESELAAVVLADPHNAADSQATACGRRDRSGRG